MFCLIWEYFHQDQLFKTNKRYFDSKKTFHFSTRKTIVERAVGEAAKCDKGKLKNGHSSLHLLFVIKQTNNKKNPAELLSQKSPVESVIFVFIWVASLNSSVGLNISNVSRMALFKCVYINWVLFLCKYGSSLNNSVCARYTCKWMNLNNRTHFRAGLLQETVLTRNKVFTIKIVKTLLETFIKTLFKTFI